MEAIDVLPIDPNQGVARFPARIFGTHRDWSAVCPIFDVLPLCMSAVDRSYGPNATMAENEEKSFLESLFQRLGLKRFQALAIDAIVIFMQGILSTHSFGGEKITSNLPFETKLGPVTFGLWENVVIFSPSPSIQMKLTLSNTSHLLFGEHERRTSGHCFWANQGRSIINDLIVSKIEIIWQ
jgi:hypothetical protein